MATTDFKEQLQQIRAKISTTSAPEKPAQSPRETNSAPSSKMPEDSHDAPQSSSDASATSHSESVLKQTTAPINPHDSSTAQVSDSESFADLLDQDATDAPIRMLADSNRHPHFDPNPPTPSTALPSISTPTVQPQWLSMADDLPEEMLTWGESISYIRSGYPQGYLKKLRRGQFRLEFTIDLHGYYLKEATRTVHQLLNVAKDHHHSAVRIIHGKGRHSSNKGPVIKSMLNHQLRLRDDVIAFCTAPAHDGGTGVLYCLLAL